VFMDKVLSQSASLLLGILKSRAFWMTVVSSKQVGDWLRFYLATSTMFSMLNGLFVNLI
jgi:hypothetical protein